MRGVVRIAGFVVCAIGAAICALIVLAARSDFTFRGCGDIPRAEWGTTANCADAWFAQVMFGGLTLGLIAGLVAIWWGERAHA